MSKIRGYTKWGNLQRLRRPYHFERSNNTLVKNFNLTQIHQWSTAVPSESKLQSIAFPLNNPSHQLHLFAISYSPSVGPPTTPQGTQGDSKAPESEAVLSVRRVRFTTKWELTNSPSRNQRAQIVEVTLANLLPTFSLSRSTSINSNHTISIKGNGIKTVRQGNVFRLVPGDQARVDVLVMGTEKMKAGERATVEVKDSRGKVVGSVGGWEVSPLVEEWTADAAVLARHEVPTWVRHKFPDND